MRNLLAFRVLPLLLLFASNSFAETFTFSLSTSASASPGTTSTIVSWCPSAYCTYYTANGTRVLLSRSVAPSWGSSKIDSAKLDLGVSPSRVTALSVVGDYTMSNSKGCSYHGSSLGAACCIDYSSPNDRISASASCTFTVSIKDLDCSGADSANALLCPPHANDECTEEQISRIDSAFFTGTHLNPPRFDMFRLPPNCPKTVVPLSTLPNSSAPAIDNNNQLNVAISLDNDGNYAGEGWFGNLTQAIFVSSEQTEEQLGCTSNEPDGYFVFCSEVNPDRDTTKVWTCEELPCPGPGNRPTDTLKVIPSVPPGGGNPGGGGGSSSSGDIANLTDWENMLRRIIPTPPNPLPLLREIKDKLFDFYDGVMEWIKPEDDPELPDLDYEPDDMKLDSLPVEPDTFDIDTIPEPDIKWLDTLFDWNLEKELDSLEKEKEKTLDSLREELDSTSNSFKKKLDSLKPDTAEVIDKTKEKVLETFKQMADEIKEAVAKGLKPIQAALPSGDGGCSCLQNSFKGLSFGIKSGSGVNVGAMGNTSLICDNIATVRKIIMVIVAVSSIGMILATFRR